MITSQLVRRRFEKAYASYPEHAHVQKQMSEHLFALWQSHNPQVQSVLELGAGTGNLTRQLAQLPHLDTLYLNDLCAESAALLTLFTGRLRHGEFLVGDMEQLLFPSSLDAVVSASSLQWVNDLPRLLDKINASLKPNGWLLIATFGPQHYQEIKALTGVGLDYVDMQCYQTLLQDAFDYLHLSANLTNIWFEHPQAILRHMQKTGVSGIAKHAWTKTKLQHFIQRYQQHYSDAKGRVRLSQHPLYIIARKRP